MPVVSGLRELPSGRVAVELDGARWRTVPAEVLVRVRLGVGEELDRPRARELARELRRARAVDTALRAVSRREQSTAELDRRLRQRGFAPGLREETLNRLERVGLVDDERYAMRRAESLSERGQGDEAIRWRLERDGVARGDRREGRRRPAARAAACAARRGRAGHGAPDRAASSPAGASARTRSRRRLARSLRTRPEAR